MSRTLRIGRVRLGLAALLAGAALTGTGATYAEAPLTVAASMAAATPAAAPASGPGSAPAPASMAAAAASPAPASAPALAPASVPSMTPAPAPANSAATAAVASAGSLTQVALVLVLVLGLIAAAAWLLKRLGMARNPGGSTVRIVSGVSLSNRERILVVEVADQWIVVGVAPGCINTLATMPRQEAAAPASGAGLPTPAGSNFALWLKQTMDKRGASGNPPGIGSGNDK